MIPTGHWDLLHYTLGTPLHHLNQSVPEVMGLRLLTIGTHDTGLPRAIDQCGDQELLVTACQCQCQWRIGIAQGV